jgi:recombination protein RecA
VGNRTRVRVVKNKVAPPFKTAEFDIMYSEGISREGGLIDLGLEMGLVKKSGAWFTVGDIRLGQGRENAKEFLRQNGDVAGAIEEQIRGNITSFQVGEVEGVEDVEEEDTGTGIADEEE